MPAAPLCIVFGLALCLLAVSGTRFHGGFRSRVPMPAWQGRAWLLIMGGMLILTGLGGYVDTSHSAWWRLAEKNLEILESLFEIFGGLIAIVAGGVYLFSRNNGNKVPLMERLMGAMFLFLGSNMIIAVLFQLRR
jgi:hypothetical protein